MWSRAAAAACAARAPRRKVGVVRVVGERLHDRVAERSHGVRKRIREVTGHPVDQPLGDAADAEAGDRHAVRPGLEADQPEWFGPQRRHDQQPRAASNASQASGSRRPTSRTSRVHAAAPARRLAARPANAEPSPAIVSRSGRASRTAAAATAATAIGGPFQALQPSEVHDVGRDPQPRRACLGEPARAVAGRGCAHAARRGARTHRRCTPRRRTPIRAAARPRGGAVATAYSRTIVTGLRPPQRRG